MNSSLQEYFSLPSNSREVHPPPCTGEEQGDCQLMQVPQQAPSIWPRQFRQGRGSCQTPGAFALIIPDIHLRTPALHADTLAGEHFWQGCRRRSSDGPQVLSAPQGHGVLPVGNSVPENTAPTELRRHSFLPTLHCADSSWTFSNCLEEKLVAFYFFSYKPPHN